MSLDQDVDRWRSHVEQRRAISPADVDEMEAHLRDQVSDLMGTGLDEDEAFLVAVRRIGNLDAVSREFAQEHTERLWKQLVASESEPRDDDLWFALALAVGAGVAARVGLALLGPERAALNAAVLVLPFVSALFVRRRRPGRGTVLAAAAAYVVGAVVLNAYPLHATGDTTLVAGLHAPVALWLLGVGVAYAGGAWRSDRRRMDLIRFTGELVVYYTLLALGGGVLVGLCAGAFAAVGVPIDDTIASWVLPIGAAGAVVVAAWLVEAKQSVVENIAPVLTTVFTPLTVLMLLAVVGAFVASPDLVHVDRSLLIVVDLILVLVLGLVLYALSARDPARPPGLFDRLQLGLVVLALVVDGLVAVTVVGRVAEWGWTANRATALGLNVVLLANLAWSAWLGLGFLRGRRGIAALERWQTAYVAVYAVWAVGVVLVVPPLFGFA